MTVSSLATQYGFQSFPNFTYGRNEAVDKIVIHHMATTDYNSVPGIWKTREASAHYGIGQNGEIRSYVDEDNTAWHAGNWSANSSSIGIEHANLSGGPEWEISQETVDASAKLVADIAQRYGFEKVVPYKNLFPHSQFIATGCPGHLKERLQEIADKANEIMGGGSVTPSEPAQPVQPSETEEDNRTEAIKEFQDKWNGKWVLKGNFTIRTCQNEYGIYQVLTDDLNTEPNSWYYNGIPTKLLEDVSDPQGRSFEDCATVRFKDEVNSGTIDAYDNNADAIGIKFNGVPGYIWFDAPKFLAHP